MRDASIIVGVYGTCAILHVVLNYTTGGAWSALMSELFPKGG